MFSAIPPFSYGPVHCCAPLSTVHIVLRCRASILFRVWKFSCWHDVAMVFHVSNHAHTLLGNLKAPSQENTTSRAIPMLLANFGLADSYKMDANLGCHEERNGTLAKLRQKEFPCLSQFRWKVLTTSIRQHEMNRTRHILVSRNQSYLLT